MKIAPLVLSVALAALGVKDARGAEISRVALTDAWRFQLDDGPVRQVRVPHDWSIAFAPEAKAPSGRDWGYYPGGVGVYRRSFVLGEEDFVGKLDLVFDGILGRAKVSVNGSGPVDGPTYDYIGFRVPLNSVARVGTNELVVTVDRSVLPASRWYAGSGIFRSVMLERRPAGTLLPGSLRVETTVAADGRSATVTLTGEIETEPGVRQKVRREDVVSDPILWSPETPKLYETAFHGERVRYGIRTLAWNAEKGFLLNGQSILLHGACVHHEHGPLGAASHPDAERRKVRQLKEAGFNAVRTSHNPFDESFLAACDEEGLLVMDDMFDGRERAKTKGDFAESFKADGKDALAWIVKRDRIHPSVVMWSVGNEILERSESSAAETTRALKSLCDELDGTRPVTQALCLWGRERWTDQDAMASALDIVGYNYLEHFTESDHARDPGRIIVYTETYPKDAAMTWRRITENPYVIGEFVWTGMDYLGESGIGRNFYTDRERKGEHYDRRVEQFPYHGAYCGDIDLTGLRKPISKYRETLWNENAKTTLAVREPNGWRGTIGTTLWSVWPTVEYWAFPGWEGKNVTAEIYSRCPRVRLTLNGRVVKDADNSAANAWLVSCDIPYEPGTLVAEGLDAAGNVRETATLKTPGEPVGVRLTEERIGALKWVTAEVVDKDGVVCPHVDREVTFKGNVLGTCSADLTDLTPAPSRTRRTWQGRAMAVIAVETR